MLNPKKSVYLYSTFHTQDRCVALNKLIGQKVIARIPGEELEDDVILKGIIINVDVNDFYFYEKKKSIYITVNPQPDPDEDISEENLEDYIDIPFEYIRLN